MIIYDKDSTQLNIFIYNKKTDLIRKLELNSNEYFERK